MDEGGPHMSVAEIVKAYRTLSAAEQAEVKALLAEDAIEDVSPEVAKMLDERIAAADANPDAAIPWEQVYQESLKRWRC
jgi:hypothetical protein